MYRYLDARRQAVVQTYHQRPLIRVWDENMHPIGQIAQEKSVQVEELMADSGSAGVVIRKDNWLSNFLLYDRRAEQDLHLTFDPIPTQQDWPMRWGGKVTTVAAKRDNTGLHTVELQAVSNREHLKHVLAGANPLFPPELQIPKMWILPWNCRTALTISLWINLARQFNPALAVIDNIANPAAWLGIDPLDFNPLAWPLQVQYINFLVDQSRTEVFTARWTDFHTASQPLLEDAGCIWRAYTYLQGDLTSPHPELAEIGNFFGLTPGLGQITEDLLRPTRNCVVFACEDKSGIGGPTGTLADGPINLIASTADDLITDTLIPEYDVNGDGQTDPLIASFFGAAPKPPWAVFYDTEFSGIIESSRTQHGSTAKTIMTGSKSPGWVNDLITFGVKYALSQLQLVITAGVFGEAGPAPVGAGLDELYQGELSDTILAYQRWSDPVREFYSGAFGFLEEFEPGDGSAWTVSGILGLRAGQWKTRAYTVYKTTVRNGSPYCVYKDYNLGDRVGFQMANVIFVDQVSGIKYSYDVNTPMNWEVSVGTDYHDVDPVSKAMRSIAGIWNMFGMFMGSNQLF